MQKRRTWGKKYKSNTLYNKKKTIKELLSIYYNLVINDKQIWEIIYKNIHTCKCAYTHAYKQYMTGSYIALYTNMQKNIKNSWTEKSNES